MVRRRRVFLSRKTKNERASSVNQSIITRNYTIGRTLLEVLAVPMYTYQPPSLPAAGTSLHHTPSTSTPSAVHCTTTVLYFTKSTYCMYIYPRLSLRVQWGRGNLAIVNSLSLPVPGTHTEAMMALDLACLTRPGWRESMRSRVVGSNGECNPKDHDWTCLRLSQLYIDDHAMDWYCLQIYMVHHTFVWTVGINIQLHVRANLVCAGADRCRQRRV